ncbi:hypothetical protein [Paraglaciecola sp. L3A3]|uniref:hypothetical protein n=1 Tax=Paraglaciecola sp. L3A3 TaxID=2686358 RepID=UPI00131E23A3|nr:hypothetical protein [Paraglaciecola sp. L3A3]
MKLTVAKQASFCHARDVENKDLRRQVKDEFAVAVRRMDNFTLTGLAAVAKLGIEFSNPDDFSLVSCAQYFSVELLQQLILDVDAGKSIRPLDFVATVGNAANFYVAKEFAIHGSNLFLGADQQAIEKTLLISALELTTTPQQQVIALVWQETQDQRTCHAMLLQTAKQDETAQTVTAEDLIAGKISTPFVLEVDDLYQIANNSSSEARVPITKPRKSISPQRTQSATLHRVKDKSGR